MQTAALRIRQTLQHLADSAAADSQITPAASPHQTSAVDRKHAHGPTPKDTPDYYRCGFSAEDAMGADAVAHRQFKLPDPDIQVDYLSRELMTELPQLMPLIGRWYWAEWKDLFEVVLQN